jgi:hypothetical protein
VVQVMLTHIMYLLVVVDTLIVFQLMVLGGMYTLYLQQEVDNLMKIDHHTTHFASL